MPSSSSHGGKRGGSSSSGHGSKSKNSRDVASSDQASKRKASKSPSTDSQASGGSHEQPEISTANSKGGSTGSAPPKLKGRDPADFDFKHLAPMTGRPGESSRGALADTTGPAPPKLKGRDPADFDFKHLASLPTAYSGNLRADPHTFHPSTQYTTGDPQSYSQDVQHSHQQAPLPETKLQNRAEIAETSTTRAYTKLKLRPPILPTKFDSDVNLPDRPPWGQSAPWGPPVTCSCDDASTTVNVDKEEACTSATLRNLTSIVDHYNATLRAERHLRDATRNPKLVDTHDQNIKEMMETRDSSMAYVKGNYVNHRRRLHPNIVQGTVTGAAEDRVPPRLLDRTRINHWTLPPPHLPKKQQHPVFVFDSPPWGEEAQWGTPESCVCNQTQTAPYVDRAKVCASATRANLVAIVEYYNMVIPEAGKSRDIAKAAKDSKFAERNIDLKLLLKQRNDALAHVKGTYANHQRDEFQTTGEGSGST